MKNLIFVISVMFIYGCNTNPNYERNLATAKKLFELHGKEDIDGQLALISDNIQSNSSLYGSETAGYDQYVNMLKDTMQRLMMLNTLLISGYLGLIV